MTITSPNPISARAPARAARQFTLVALILTIAAVQFSIAIAESLFGLAIVGWIVVLAAERRWPKAPPWMLPLLFYAGWTMVSTLASPDVRTSLLEAKQLVLLLIVPLAYEIVTAESALSLTTIALAAGAASAVVGIGQFAILHYDNLGLRPRSTLGLYLTFSGLMMLTLELAVARVLFMNRARMWAALVIPALAVAIPLSFGRSSLVGACCAVALLLMMRDFRLTALLPVAAALLFALAPGQVVQRVYSIFDLNNPSNHDRIEMMRSGMAIIRDHPITGVGPNMIARVYPHYREPSAVLQVAPHLHNVPLQIAAERGLPALAVWVWFITAAALGAARLFRAAPREGVLRFLAAAALAAIVAMLGAGMFEHTFGDSEFQLLFLVLITLPFAVAREGN
jgi:putative inorganic carbon (HCO3(-)) transporter